MRKPRKTNADRDHQVSPDYNVGYGGRPSIAASKRVNLETRKGDRKDEKRWVRCYKMP